MPKKRRNDGLVDLGYDVSQPGRWATTALHEAALRAVQRVLARQQPLAEEQAQPAVRVAASELALLRDEHVAGELGRAHDHERAAERAHAHHVGADAAGGVRGAPAL